MAKKPQHPFMPIGNTAGPSLSQAKVLPDEKTASLTLGGSTLKLEEAYPEGEDLQDGHSYDDILRSHQKSGIIVKNAILDTMMGWADNHTLSDPLQQMFAYLSTSIHVTACEIERVISMDEDDEIFLEGRVYFIATKKMFTEVIKPELEEIIADEPITLDLQRIESGARMKPGKCEVVMRVVKLKDRRRKFKVSLKVL